MPLPLNIFVILYDSIISQTYSIFQFLFYFLLAIQVVLRLMQQTLFRKGPKYLNVKYWARQGWFGKTRP